MATDFGLVDPNQQSVAPGGSLAAGATMDNIGLMAGTNFAANARARKAARDFEQARQGTNRLRAALAQRGMVNDRLQTAMKQVPSFEADQFPNAANYFTGLVQGELQPSRLTRGTNVRAADQQLRENEANIAAKNALAAQRFFNADTLLPQGQPVDPSGELPAVTPDTIGLSKMRMAENRAGVQPVDPPRADVKFLTPGGTSQKWDVSPQQYLSMREQGFIPEEPMGGTPGGGDTPTGATRDTSDAIEWMRSRGVTIGGVEEQADGTTRVGVIQPSDGSQEIVYIDDFGNIVRVEKPDGTVIEQ